MQDENKGMWCSLCTEHMRKIGHLCHGKYDVFK
jgi:hypothetical protein